MYYEETIKYGVLCSRNRPDGDWQAVSYDQLLGKYWDQQREIERLRRELAQAQEVPHG